MKIVSSSSHLMLMETLFGYTNMNFVLFFSKYTSQAILTLNGHCMH